ncbi:MAG: F0F1 ATP synthase subunit gamma [Anaerolineae bacterium]|nr:F0F1 ATP synthase subunit gamma [Anaerolineae bacterium]
MAQVATDLEQRLKSLADIHHLLRSIRAMSAIRWRRARARLRSAQEYVATVDRQLALAATFPTALTRGARSTARGLAAGESMGLITLTSDRGLCGTFNVGLVAHAMDFIEREHEKGWRIKVIALGEYGERFFRRANCELLYTRDFPLTHVISFVEARDIVAQVKHFYETEVFSTLYLIYNRFISFGRYQRVEVRLLPPDLAAVMQDKSDIVPEGLIMGTPPLALQNFLLWEHLATQIYLALIESMVSEQGARLQTMDAAISNLDERVARLQLQYHALRQENITREVLAVQCNARSRHGGRGAVA